MFFFFFFFINISVVFESDYLCRIVMRKRYFCALSDRYVELVLLYSVHYAKVCIFARHFSSTGSDYLRSVF